MGHKAKATLEKEAKTAARKEANKSLSPKQIRARARRANKLMADVVPNLYKPLDEWDAEELARGRCRDKNGHFTGVAPKWITREIHEETVKRFEQIVKTEMNVHTIEALTVLQQILQDDSTDDNGKPRTPAGTKLEAAKFLLEHIVGKPTQRVEQDISVKLQGVLGMAMVVPGTEGVLRPAIDATVIEAPEELNFKDEG